ncbi:hypothetical protein, partial [Novosphingobium sp. Fuku2-ISO-50]|uniref:hypothetical protein n=1 Tax=Novosphingobium sp. Fuku2-ISO-50 TaxID=1739114 RepID=UPI0012E34F4C
MDQDLFVAILALDSYDRGYDSDLSYSLSDAIGTKIGNATVIAHSSDAASSNEVQAGFYAIAYDWDGTTVISYRGTNFDFTGGTGSPIFKDFLNGWSLFTGIGTNSRVPGTQYPIQRVPGTQYPIQHEFRGHRVPGTQYPIQHEFRGHNIP